MKKKIKLTYAGKIYLLVLCCISVFLIGIFIKNLFVKNKSYLGKSSNDEPIQIVDKSLDYIVDTSESDDDIIKEKFSKGMNLESFISVCNHGYNYVDKKGSYSYINYDFDRKLHYSDIEKILYSINNSSIVKLDIIGKSADNRNIYGVEIGKGDEVIYLDANIHAAEVASTLFLTRFLNDLVNKYENGDKDIVSALNTFKIVAIPSINPDGYEVFNFGIESIRNHNLWIYKNKDSVDFDNFKYNANGVDLNRNFPSQNAGLYYKNKKLINSVSLQKTTKRLTYFGGEELGSEPETRASMYFILKHYKNSVLYLNLHSQGRVIYAGKPNLSSEFNNTTLDFADNVSNFTGYIVQGLSYEEVGEGNDGSITDFYAEILNGFKFSSKTLRLSNDKYIGGNINLVNNIPVMTLETLTTYTDDPSVFKTEYYDFGLEELFYSLLKE